MDNVLEIEGLAKTFRIGFFRKKVEALREATFKVPQGSVFGLLGPNGAGKTTTMKILLGLIHPDAGKGTLLGHPIGTLKSRQKLGYLPEAPYFYDYLTAPEVVAYHGRLYGLDAQTIKTRGDALLERVGLSHALERPLRKFSKGMLQRTGLACALLHDPDFVILDEPKTGLDPLGRKLVSDIILELKTAGKTVLFASHILSDVEAVCDRVAVMTRGRVVDVGALQDLVTARMEHVELVVKGDREVVEQLGGSVRERRDEYVVLLESEALAEAALAQAVQSGLKVIKYQQHRESLEDVFLRETSDK